MFYVLIVCLHLETFEKEMNSIEIYSLREVNILMDCG